MNITLGSVPNLIPPIIAPAPINVTPGNAEVANAVVISSRVKRQKLEHPATVTNQELRDAVVYEKKVVEAHAGATVAPPWFAGAIQAALVPIIVRLDDLKVDVAKAQNASATMPEHTIQPVRVNNVVPVVHANNVNLTYPATVLDLINMGGQEVNAFLTTYGESTTGNVATRKNRFAVFLGLRIKVA